MKGEKDSLGEELSIIIQKLKQSYRKFYILSLKIMQIKQNGRDTYEFIL
jgi:hypothetical protein